MLALTADDLYWPVLSLFLLSCGVCTAVILWQARRVLQTILRGEPFTWSNAVSLRRAAWACFLIAGAALVRVTFSVCHYHSPQAPGDLQRALCADVRHGRAAVSGHVRSLPSGGGTEGGE